MTDIDLQAAREIFEESTDFTVGIEEEFALLDPGSLDLVQRFEELKDASQKDTLLVQSVAGELISSEIEIRSGRGESFQAAADKQMTVRKKLFNLAADKDIALAAMATHPWAPWQEQHIIDSAHYRRVEEGLKYVAWRNNTFSVHVHVGVRGADRAIAACDKLSELLPQLLALSANSTYVDGRQSGLHSVRSQIFTKSFPRCGIPDVFGDWDGYAQLVEFLVRTNSVVEPTQLWWSVRPHLSFGTVEVRICDAQSNGSQSLALIALMAASVAQATYDYDDGNNKQPIERRLIEENFWRAIRYGLDGNMIDLPNPVEITTKAALEKIFNWCRPAATQMGIVSYFDDLYTMIERGNGAQLQMHQHSSGSSMREVLLDAINTTKETYVPDSNLIRKGGLYDGK